MVVWPFLPAKPYFISKKTILPMSYLIFLFEIKTNFKKLLLEIIRLALFLPLFLNHLCRKSAF